MRGVASFLSNKAHALNVISRAASNFTTPQRCSRRWQPHNAFPSGWSLGCPVELKTSRTSRKLSPWALNSPSRSRLLFRNCRRLRGNLLRRQQGQGWCGGLRGTWPRTQRSRGDRGDFNGMEPAPSSSR